MKSKKRKSLKKTLVSGIIIYVAIIIVIITQLSIKIAADNIESLTYNILAKESATYTGEVYSWRKSIEERVKQTGDVMRNLPVNSDEDTLKMLLKLTELDPDSHDVYIANGDTGAFLDGSGWTPDESFDFSQREWYTGAIEAKGDIFWTQPYLDAATGTVSIACSTLLDGKKVLSSDIGFDEVEKQISDFKSISPDAKLYIVNKDNKDIIISNVEGAAGQNLDSAEDPVAAGFAKVFDSLNTDVGADGDKVDNVKTDKGAQLVTASDIEGTNWVAVSAVPASILSESILKVMIITFVSTIIFLLILSFIIYFIISKAINPVTKVTESITEISKGDFTVNLVPEGNNEITTLSESLNDY
nr:HAMP domain-containing protein [Lachnospiraceae bacterium]